jgi:Ca2+-binding EF-hand superfamily protein
MSFKSLIALALAAGWASAALPASGAAEQRPMGRTAQPAAQPSLQGADQRFAQLDRNRDGYLSRDEANDAVELNTRFSELDANNDGKLSRDEYRVVAAGETETLPGAPTAATGATRR